jgi:hypothetical protein
LLQIGASADTQKQVRNNIKHKAHQAHEEESPYNVSHAKFIAMIKSQFFVWQAFFTFFFVCLARFVFQFLSCFLRLSTPNCDSARFAATPLQISVRAPINQTKGRMIAPMG